MARDIKNVIVDGISLVTKDYTPAVERAETRFALFKATPNWLIKLCKAFGFDNKPKKPLSKSQSDKLDGLITKLSA